MVGGGNQHMEEEDRVENITVLTTPPVSANKVVVPNATPVSSTVGNDTLDGKCNTTEPSPHIPRGCQDTATTCVGIPAVQPVGRTTGSGRCGDWEPRWSDF
jgi:hypothetical protein